MNSNELRVKLLEVDLRAAEMRAEGYLAVIETVAAAFSPGVLIPAENVVHHSPVVDPAASPAASPTHAASPADAATSTQASAPTLGPSGPRPKKRKMVVVEIPITRPRTMYTACKAGFSVKKNP